MEKEKKTTQYRIRTSDRAYGCMLRASKSEFRFQSAAACPYDTETVLYAVCRYIRHCPELRDPLIRRAVSLGLSTERRVRRVRRVVSTAASKLALPGGRAVLTLSVGQGEIVVKSLKIEERGDRRPAPGKEFTRPRPRLRRDPAHFSPRRETACSPAGSSSDTRR